MRTEVRNKLGRTVFSDVLGKFFNGSRINRKYLGRHLCAVGARQGYSPLNRVADGIGEDKVRAVTGVNLGQPCINLSTSGEDRPEMFNTHRLVFSGGYFIIDLYFDRLAADIDIHLIISRHPGRLQHHPHRVGRFHNVEIGLVSAVSKGLFCNVAPGVTQVVKRGNIRTVIRHHIAALPWLQHLPLYGLPDSTNFRVIGLQQKHYQ
ncbi:MAG: hypothetical protein HY028_07185 [Gammaproteobacteria bacterium]|nr:hypothetical protein [Gammaproteobacteria bacterium]